MSDESSGEWVSFRVEWQREEMSQQQLLTESESERAEKQLQTP